MSHALPSPADLKQQARAMRRVLARSDRDITHSQSLEVLAAQWGHRDWNTLQALASTAPTVPFTVGQRITGTYLGKAISGEIIALAKMPSADHFRVTIRFDAPVDVVSFEGLSSFRRQVNAVVNRSGRTAEKTSDGMPHLVLEV